MEECGGNTGHRMPHQCISDIDLNSRRVRGFVCSGDGDVRLGREKAVKSCCCRRNDRHGVPKFAALSCLILPQGVKVRGLSPVGDLQKRALEKQFGQNNFQQSNIVRATVLAGLPYRSLLDTQTGWPR